jgi:putative ABC transport system permease protein
MIENESIKYSLRNIKNSRSRTILTIFSILIGITTLFIFVSFGLGLYEYIDTLMGESSANLLLVQPKGGFVPGLDDSIKLTQDDLETIKKVAGVKSATGVYMKPVSIKQGSTLKYTFLMAYDPSEPLIMNTFNIDIEKGRNLRPSDMRKVVLGNNYQKKDIIFKNSYSVGKKIIVDNFDMTIVGFYESVGSPQDDAQIYITNRYFEELYPEVDYYAMIVVEAASENDLESLIERIEKRLRRQRDLEIGEEDFYVQSFEDLINSYTGALNIVIGFIILIALISVLVSSVNTANTMITSVLERYKEIGVLKAIGAKNSEIFKIFLFESAFLGFIAGCLGVFFGFIFVYITEQILNNIGYGFLTPSYSPLIFVGCILFATITGAISGVFPSINASKINTVDALRYE